MEVYDIIHGNIMIDPLATRIINTEEFQRLRNIKQLGCCNYVFPSAVHTRFEHSIGVYHLASKYIEILKKEIQFTENQIKCILCAALIHDLGHGPYSHLFDELFDESKNHEWLKIKQRQMVDAWGGYDIVDSQTGEHLGTVRRKFWASILRTRWHLLDAQGTEIGVLMEDSMKYALARRLVLGIFLPKKFSIMIGGLNEVVTIRQMFNPFLKKTVVNIPPNHPLDRRFIAGLAIVIAAVDSRGR